MTALSTFFVPCQYVVRSVIDAVTIRGRESLAHVGYLVHE
jgi:hypothetical protein